MPEVTVGKYCGGKNDIWGYVKRRLPVLGWLKDYRGTWLLQDALAGLTVGLTAIPQGVAYAVVAGLSPEYGLYAAFMASFVYIIFGSCESITIGPTAIMATMARELISKCGPGVIVLLTFLKGCIIAGLGLCHLGFLLDFISLPVITGFTAAAAVNIAASQFKPLLGLTGKSEGLVNSLISIFSDIRAIRYQDTLLGLSSIGLLILLKNVPSIGSLSRKITRAISLSRNTVVVVIGTLMAYLFQQQGLEPFKLTGSVGRGLPSFTVPTFNVTYDGESHYFYESNWFLTTLFSIVMISTVQHMAVAKSFARGKSLDSSQEMLALGLCNVFGSFVSSMPVTGSFTRTAVNQASGVKTTFGGFFTGCLVLLALGSLTSTFRLIPKASLAAVIVCAMYYMLDFPTYSLLWRAKKIDFFLMCVTFFLGVLVTLEWGIVIGIVSHLMLLLYSSVRPAMDTIVEQVEGQTVLRIVPEEAVGYPAAEHIRANILKLSKENVCDVILDCRNLKRIDVTVAKNLKLLAADLLLHGQNFACVNCRDNVSAVLMTVAPELLAALKHVEGL